MDTNEAAINTAVWAAARYLPGSRMAKRFDCITGTGWLQ